MTLERCDTVRVTKRYRELIPGLWTGNGERSWTGHKMTPVARHSCRILQYLWSFLPEHVNGAWNGAQRAANRVERSGGVNRRGRKGWSRSGARSGEKIIEIRLSAECFFCRSHYAHMLCTGVVWCCTCSLGRASKPAMSCDRNTFNGDQ